MIKKITTHTICLLAGIALSFCFILPIKSQRIMKEDPHEKTGVFWISELDFNGDLKNQILADYYRKNIETGEFICKDFYSNDLYILSGNVVVRDLTKTVDYIRFTTEEWSVK